MTEEKKKFIYIAVDFLYDHIKTIMTVLVFVTTTSWAAYNKYLEVMDRILTLESKLAATELEVEKLIYANNGTKSSPLPNLLPPGK